MSKRIRPITPLWFVACSLGFAALAVALRPFANSTAVERNRWSIQCPEGAVGSIERSGADPSGVVIRIDRLPPSASGIESVGAEGLISATYRGVKIERGQPYTLQFRAKSNTGRLINVRVSEDHAPWSDLGLSTTTPLTTQWGTAHLPFVASDDESAASVVLGIGGGTGAVAVDSLELKPGRWGWFGPPSVWGELESSEDGKRHKLMSRGPAGVQAAIIGPAFAVEVERRYVVSFRASSAGGGPLRCRVIDCSPQGGIVAETNFDLTNAPQQCYFEFEPTRPVRRARIELSADASSGGFSVEDVDIRPLWVK